MTSTTFETRRKRLWIPLGVLGLLMVAGLACASQVGDVDGFDFERSYTLQSNEQRNSDQLIIAYEIVLEAGSSVDGTATLIGNKVSFEAEVEGDVVVVADQLSVGDAAYIKGDLIACVNTLERSAGARIDGDVNRECSEGSTVSATNLFESGISGWRHNLFVRLGSSVAGALILGALAALSTVIFPQPLIRMADSIRQSPGTTVSVGCLTFTVAIGLTVAYLVSLLLVVPVLLLPLMLVGWLVVGLASLLGWVALAEPFGNFLFRRLGIRGQPPMIVAAVGGVVLTFLVRIWSVFWFTAWIGLLASVILGALGLGAVVLTRIGTRSFPRTEPESAAV